MKRPEDASALWFWKVSGTLGRGHLTYAPNQLVREGPFTNPARMIEDVMGHDPTRWYVGGRSDSEFYADVWALAGWFDKRSIDP